MRPSFTPMPFRAAPAGLPTVLFAAALVVFATLLPGLHGLSLGGHGCDQGSCTDNACSSDKPRPAAVAVVPKARSSCSCGHDLHSHEPPASLTAAATADPAHGACDSHEDDPQPAPHPHDHHDCPICKVIFTGAHRLAVISVAITFLASAESLDTPLQSTLDAPRLVRWDSARPRGPPASPRA